MTIKILPGGESVTSAVAVNHHKQHYNNHHKQPTQKQPATPRDQELNLSALVAQTIGNNKINNCLGRSSVGAVTTRHPELEAEIVEMTKRAKSSKYHKKWIRRLKIFFCCLGYKKNKDSIADVASIFADLYADLDVPSKDIAAGFVLLSKYQDAQRQWIVSNKELGVESYLSSVPITDQTKFLDISTAEDSHLINDLIYYMNYSLAIFGWPMQVIDDPCMLCCIYPYLRISPCCSGWSKKPKVRASIDEKVKTTKKTKDEEKNKKQEERTGDKNPALDATIVVADRTEDNNKNNNRNSRPGDVENTTKPEVGVGTTYKPGELSGDCDAPIILDDNCCGCNMASAERRLASHNYEIIYVSYKVNVHVVPFLVAADHSKQTIVVALRGSMSLSDMITDLNGQTDKLPIENCPDDWLCHRGITRAACHVRTKLLKEHILDRAFNCRPDLGSKDYTLILCGHSLGAGAAAILGILLRPQYPTLKAYLYAPPGGILSLPAVEYTKQFATGIFLGHDCVPRLGIAQLERLRYYVLLSQKSSQVSSGKILAKAVCPSWCCLGKNQVDYDPEKSLNVLYGTRGRSFDYSGCKIPFQVQPQVLYVPGRLIHIVKNHNFKSTARRLFKEPIYQAIWNDNTLYDRIVIGEGMFYDHLPNKLMDGMKMLFSKTLPARRESRLSRSNSATTYTASPTYPSLDCQHLALDGFCDHIGRDGEVLTPPSSDKLQVVSEDKLEIEADENNNNNNNYTSDENNNNEVSFAPNQNLSDEAQVQEGLGAIETEIIVEKNRTPTKTNTDELKTKTDVELDKNGNKVESVAVTPN